LLSWIIPNEIRDQWRRGGISVSPPDQKVGFYLIRKFEFAFVQKWALNYDWTRFDGFKVQNANSGQHLPRSFTFWSGSYEPQRVPVSYDPLRARPIK
jgi:hypothetical protein